MEIFKLSAWVFLGGGLGSIMRFGLSRLQYYFLPTQFPIGTLLANILSCILLGLMVFGLKEKIELNEWLKYFFIVGFCGGFSTFSTFGFETISLLRDGHLLLATLNVLISLGLGFAILWFFMRA